MTKCVNCKDENYKPYIVFLCDKIESMGFEMSLREIYYDQEKDEGLCEDCRKKLMKDDVWVWRHWLLVTANIMCVRSRMKGGEKIKWTKALKRIDGHDKRLEKTEAVKKILAQNKKSMEEGEDYGYF